MRFALCRVFTLAVFGTCAFDPAIGSCDPPDAAVESRLVPGELREWRVVLKQRGLEPGYKIAVSSSGSVRIERGKDRGNDWKLVQEGELPAEQASEILVVVGRMLSNFRLDSGAANEGSDARLVLSLQCRSRRIEIEWDFEDSKGIGGHTLLNEFVRIIDAEVPGTDVGRITR